MKFKNNFKEFNTADWGKMAVTGILAGAVGATWHVGYLWEILLNIASVLGWVCLFVWIYRKIKKI